MTYDEVKKQVLRLLNQYKIADNPGQTASYQVTPETYNNQGLYTDRIPGLVNDAIMEISTTVRKIEKTVQLSTAWSPNDVENLGNSYSFKMPGDFFAYKSGDNWLLVDGRPMSHQLFTELGVLRTAGRTTAGSHFITLPKRLVDNHEVYMTYYCYPTLLPDSPTGSTTLDSSLPTEVLRAIPYYAAGMLALHDDPFLASNLMNAYEDKLSKMAPPPSAEIAPTRDVYGFNWRVDRDYL